MWNVDSVTNSESCSLPGTGGVEGAPAVCISTANNGTLVGGGPQAWKTHSPLWFPDQRLRSQKAGLSGHLHSLRIVATRNTGLGM